MKTIIIPFIILLGLFSTPAQAQIDTSSFTNTESSIELHPQFPEPGEEVTATLNDYSGNSFGSNINWVIDEQNIITENNQRKIIFTASESGVRQNIKAILTKPSGVKITLEHTLTPLYLDIIIEPQTHTPDFYQGRSLPSIGSTVNATAIISGGTLKNSSMVYTWRIGRQVVEGGSLRGRNKISYTTPRGSNSTLSLTVTDLNGETIASRAVLVPSVEPYVLFYEYSSLFGISKKSISSLNLIGQSAIIKAEPFNLDSTVYNNPDISEWGVDSRTASTLNTNPYKITIQRSDDKGVSSLNFHVRDLTQVLQGAKADIEIRL